jgi:thiamine biosynthesis lipoprotein
MTADAYSTACMVLGFEKAREFVQQLDNVQAYFVYSSEEGGYLEWYTQDLTKYIE